ncbi:Uncharacterised protein, partial [Metamycoplasma alkalescens]
MYKARNNVLSILSLLLPNTSDKIIPKIVLNKNNAIGIPNNQSVPKIEFFIAIRIGFGW